MELFVWNFLLVLFQFLVEFANPEEMLQEDLLEYPIIVNSDVDKAVFIMPNKGCQVYTHNDGIESVILKQSLNVYKEDRKTVDDIIKLCELYQNETIDANEFLRGVRIRAFLIYPGTNWCGAGNRASNETDLGYNIETDKCCREHDYCQDYIDGFTCHVSNGLCNRTPFTRSHCDCDERLRECLQRANETASRRIGTLFFTVFGLKCFRQDYPATKCLEYGGFLHIHCQKYLLNYEENPTFQFFDSPKYNISITQLQESSYEEEWNQGSVQMSISLQNQTTSTQVSKVKHLSF